MFNEALTKVVAEKEKKIDELQERAAALQADSDKYRSEWNRQLHSKLVVLNSIAHKV